jgi:hypothetical protein
MRRICIPLRVKIRVAALVDQQQRRVLAKNQIKKRIPPPSPKQKHGMVFLKRFQYYAA